MNNKKRDKLIDKLLIFMKKEIEKHGLPLSNVWFNFKFAESGYYMGGGERDEPDGEDLQNFKKEIEISNDDFEAILKYCNTHNYLEGRQERTKLTQKGMARANSVEKNSKSQKIMFWLANNVTSLIIGIIVTVVGGLSLLKIAPGGANG